MARYQIEKKKSSSQLLEKAKKYFGGQKLNMPLIDESDCCLRYESAGGFVSVSVSEQEKKSIMVLETREFDYDVVRFLETV